MRDPDWLPVRLVLDRSALLAYLAGSLHVGEPLHEVVADGGRFGVPVVVIAETMAVVSDGKDRAILRRLFALDSCVILGVDPDDELELTYWRGVTGRLDLAAAALAAFVCDASVLSGESLRYGSDVPVIHMPA